MGMFSAFRLPLLSLGSLLQGPGGRKAGEVVFAYWGALCCSVLTSSLCLPGVLRLLLPVGTGEANECNALFGRKASQVCRGWGKVELSARPDRRELSHVSMCLETTERG